MSLRVENYDTRLEELNKNLKLSKDIYFKTNKFIIISEKDNKKLLRIANDKNFLNNLVNIYPGYGKISYIDEIYKILFVCHIEKIDEILEYFEKNYGTELEIREMIDPSINFDMVANAFIGNISEEQFEIKEESSCVIN